MAHNRIQKMSLQSLMYLFHHVFLPPQLPQRDDSGGQHDAALLTVVADALEDFGSFGDHQHGIEIEHVRTTITRMLAVHDRHDNGHIVNDRLQATLRDVGDQGGSVALHVRQQNAGMLISRVDESDTCFHVSVFELSATNKATMTTKGRLARTFPACTMSIHAHIFTDANFQVTVAATVAKMSCQPASGTRRTARKAGKDHDEDRDATHPKIMTELFVMGLLAPVGEPVAASHIQKNTRDEVMWRDSLLPWRRSPLWLLTRVVMQLEYGRLCSSMATSDDLYKTFMVFLMSRVLHVAQAQGLASDILYIMMAKIARRLRKLNSCVSELACSAIQQSLSNAKCSVDAKWIHLTTHSGPSYNFSSLANINFEQDTLFEIPALDRHLWSTTNSPSTQSATDFCPSPDLVRYDVDDVRFTPSRHNGDYAMYNLIAFESWVASNLTTWLGLHLSEQQTCRRLSDMIHDYHATAAPLYSGNPEALSTMLLTITELWLACDRSAISVCELLQDYDPDIPTKLLQSLILPSMSQMSRLLQVEEYFQVRKARAVFAASYIYGNFGHKSSFAVRYFNDSDDHQILKGQIEESATRARDAKRNELCRRKCKHESLMRQHNESYCEYEDVVTDSFLGFSEQRHRPQCRKCRCLAEAAGMKIRIHEWPLPKEALQAKATVFELQVPATFGFWRDITMFYKLDVLENDYMASDQPRAMHFLATYSGLNHCYRAFGSKQRVCLLSQTKPHEVTHRREQNVGTATESSVCLDNGLLYQYYDQIDSHFVGMVVITNRAATALTYTQPARASTIQRFMFRPSDSAEGLPPNTVIASQADCPEYMSLEEYRALASLPLGLRVQWLNVLTQLCAPSVDFKRVEVNVMILQIAYQAGPPAGGVLRSSHQHLGDIDFGQALLQGLRDALGRITENWQSSHALSTFICLAKKILTLSTSQSLQKGCLEFLAAAREVAFTWMRSLKNKAHGASHNTQKEYTAKAVEAALICADTFGIDDSVRDHVLHSDENASILLQCSIVVQEGSRGQSDLLDYTTRLLYYRWQTICYLSYRTIAATILNSQGQALDNAIGLCWAAYAPGHGWSRYSDEADYWVITRTGHDDSGTIDVQFNLLTGELLAAGVPLTSLPSEYVRHPTFDLLFHDYHSLEVMPSAIPGMAFSSKKNIAGHTIHFALRNREDPDADGKDLAIRAVKQTSEWELVPSRVFEQEFPVDFVQRYVHWYNRDEDIIEFRPLSKPWESAPDGWKMVHRNSKWHVTRPGRDLLCPKSSTARFLHDIFSPLEGATFIHLVLRHSDTSLRIILPKLQLEFYIQPAAPSISSKQFRGMSIDSDQCLQTLVGLQSRLVLKDEHGGRLVLVPVGPISATMTSQHVTVSVDTSSSAKAQSYRLDDILGRFDDNGSLESRLYLCYLHALTSFCVPDPFTGMTGTEQALLILNSAAMRSSQRLRIRETELLAHLAGLTPERMYYPAHERVMQTVNWSLNLSPLAQHGGFYKSVKSIFEHYERFKMFHRDDYVAVPALPKLDEDLLIRDCIRTSTFRVAGYGADDFSAKHDHIYEARDRGQDSSTAIRAFSMSSLTNRGHGIAHFRIADDLEDRLWDFLSQSSSILGPNCSLMDDKLGYDASLITGASAYLQENWTPLLRVLGQSQACNKFDLMAWTSSLAFGQGANLDVIQTLAMACSTSAVALGAPPYQHFELVAGRTVLRAQLSAAVRSVTFSLKKSPEAKFVRLDHESHKTYKRRVEKTFEKKRDEAVNEVLNSLQAQWPCERPTNPTVRDICKSYLDVGQAVQASKVHFLNWHKNKQFYDFLGQVKELLRRQHAVAIEPPRWTFPASTCIPLRKRGYIVEQDILSASAPEIGAQHATLNHLIRAYRSVTTVNVRLTQLAERLNSQGRSPYERRYAGRLDESLHALREARTEYTLTSGISQLEEKVSRYMSQCRDRVKDIHEAMDAAVVRATTAGSSCLPSAIVAPLIAAQLVKHCPRTCPTSFLQLLRSKTWDSVPTGWRKCLTQYGLAITKLQQAKRLVKAVNDPSEFVKELSNPGHSNWDPDEHPDSLLLEVDGGILIRNVQEVIARNMRNPPNHINATMQLNMGEGKSSVIIPMVAAAIADTSQLARVVIAKSHSRQMSQLLASKLGRLLDRPIYHTPFSRASRPTLSEVKLVLELSRECMANRGVLLMQPEHILSFKLMGLEGVISGKAKIGRGLLQAQRFFDENARDIVDESDENFSTKFELIYTMGLQQPVEHSPGRWGCVHQILSLMMEFTSMAKEKFPRSIEVQSQRPGRFPRTRFLRSDAQDWVLCQIAKRVCETGVTGFPVGRQPVSVKDSIFTFVTNAELTLNDTAATKLHSTAPVWANGIRETLLLLRGLIAGGILAFAFAQKRWRVDFGLDKFRQPATRLAVPYRAKDTPSLRSEFSHPDVVLVLTSLCYYYNGLDDDNMFHTLEYLVKSDQADAEYQLWVRQATDLPPSFRQLTGINLKDRTHCIQKLFPPLRFVKEVVDYFLSHIVFPKEMKEFPQKLSASSWDLARVKENPTTGFSGTNDSRETLPLDIRQLDLDMQHHTNAMVLDHLLQPRNSVATLSKPDAPAQSDAALLLRLVTVMDPPVRVILDVGAQILELCNEEVATMWLSMESDHDSTQAAVFFNNDDELCVRDRSGHVELLQTSSFSRQLDLCVVYLDEVHTRGTDLVLPAAYRAAVTLGARLTKDRLVQACMRMRKLGSTQSVILIAPEDICDEILLHASKDIHHVVEVIDVILWTISQTFAEVRRNMPLWAVQGERFDRQNAIWREAITSQTTLTTTQAAEFLEPESATLADRYWAPRKSARQDPRMTMRSRNVELIRARCREFNDSNRTCANLHEEQERELSPEIEEERHVERPPHAEPAIHHIHAEMLEFVATGALVPNTQAYQPAFQSLRSTSAAAFLDVTEFPSDLLVSADYAQTIIITIETDFRDLYQRPVHFVLTSVRDPTSTSPVIEHIMIISSYEAEHLQAAIRHSKYVTLHIYAPRPHQGFHALDGLGLYTIPKRPWTLSIPPRFTIQLNLFAGQLYFDSFSEYTGVCEFLGLALEPPKDGHVIDFDGFLSGTSKPSKSAFIHSPVQFLKNLMTKIRRNCQEIEHTHIGKVLSGKLLTLADFGEDRKVVLWSQQLTGPARLAQASVAQGGLEIDGGTGVGLRTQGVQVSGMRPELRAEDLSATDAFNHCASG